MEDVHRELVHHYFIDAVMLEARHAFRVQGAYALKETNVELCTHSSIYSPGTVEYTAGDLSGAFRRSSFM